MFVVQCSSRIPPKNFKLLVIQFQSYETRKHSKSCCTKFKIFIKSTQIPHSFGWRKTTTATEKMRNEFLTNSLFACQTFPRPCLVTVFLIYLSILEMERDKKSKQTEEKKVRKRHPFYYPSLSRNKNWKILHQRRTQRCENKKAIKRKKKFCTSPPAFPRFFTPHDFQSTERSGSHSAWSLPFHMPMGLSIKTTMKSK